MKPFYDYLLDIASTEALGLDEVINDHLRMPQLLNEYAYLQELEKDMEYKNTLSIVRDIKNKYFPKGDNIDWKSCSCDDWETEILEKQGLILINTDPLVWSDRGEPDEEQMFESHVLIFNKRQSKWCVTPFDEWEWC